MASYFERLESATTSIAEKMIGEEGETIAKGSMEAHATLTLAMTVGAVGLAISEALGGVENACRDIDAQINTLGGELHEQLRTGNRLLEEIDRALRG